ncbi:PDZ domain-containing protein [Psychromicrobium xiongbiense]|uniref:YlbL family protein n=1 Tax=Psychromicrobium xiongbiense TaxID=3051184 RepID=UPI0025557599|nr:S16 family serine protease [Psychromicrobium sp. YIM S02556]
MSHLSTGPHGTSGQLSDVSPEHTPTQRQQRRRTIVLTVSGLLTLALTVLALVLPAPYVVESPGPVFNTLGKSSGKSVITVTGATSYPSTGQLDMLTVYVDGGPANQLSAIALYQAWLNPDTALYPVDLIYPPDATADQINQQSVADMVDSQDMARAAALTYLKIPFTQKLSVAQVGRGTGSDGKLKPGDVLTAVDGAPVTSRAVLTAALAKSKGATVAVEVLRSGQPVTLSIQPSFDSASGRYLLGIGLKYDFTFPFTIDFALSNVGGPSAGMMFALATIDKLTPDDLTGGKHVAGTGTIDADGNVGPIGGIVQKMIGASKDGATLFLAPSSNCNEVVGHVPSGLKVMRVDTLSQAHDAVAAYGAGKDLSAFPSCTAS